MFKYPDRPVAGNINICPGAFGETAHSVHLEIATVKHEIFHILVSAVLTQLLDI